MRYFFYIIGLVAFFAVLLFFLHVITVYKTGGGQIDSWNCRGVTVDIYCKSHFPTLLPPTCYIVCFGEARHITVNDVINQLDFYKEGRGFLNIFK